MIWFQPYPFSSEEVKQETQDNNNEMLPVEMVSVQMEHSEEEGSTENPLDSIVNMVVSYLILL
jgi:formylglycine-generating enzyme required for sulfatase activity